MRDTARWIDEKLSGGVDESALYLKCRVLVTQAQSSIYSEELHKTIIEQLGELISRHPDKHGGWLLLIDYEANVRRDPDAAIELLAKWKGFLANRTENTSQSLQYLGYIGARMLFDIAISDRRRIREAIEAYIDVLVGQPRNTIALAEFIDLMNRAPRQTVVDLNPLVAGKLRDGPQLAWLHAAMRAMFDCGQTIKSGHEFIATISAILYPDEGSINGTIARLGELLKSATFVDLVILELVSKYYFRRGRQERNGDELTTADYLLRAGLAADPDDVVWTSRRIDVALEQRAWPSAGKMLRAALEAHPQDAILKFQFARLQALQGDVEQAETILRQLLPSGTATLSLT